MRSKDLVQGECFYTSFNQTFNKTMLHAQHDDKNHAIVLQSDIKTWGKKKETFT